MSAHDDAPPTLEEAWPIYGLRVRTERLELRLPTVGDILDLADVARAGIHAPDEMPFGIAWTDVPDPEFERSFVAHHWDARRSWRPTDWALHLMVVLDERPIGAQSLLAEDFAARRSVHTGSWLGRSWQGRGFGTEMRSAILALAFDGLRAAAAETEAFLDNAASNAVSRSLGYEETGRGSLAPRGTPRETQRFRMTAEGWRSRPRPVAVVEGLDGCRDLFGA